jgi:hypothetical protein
MQQIVRTVVIGPKQIRLYFANGDVRDFDFTSDAQRGGFFADIAQPGFLGHMSLGPLGIGLEWPSGLGYCADWLWSEGVPVDAESATTVIVR